MKESNQRGAAIQDAADAQQRDAFKQQLPDLLAFTGGDALRVSDELTTAFFTPMILFAVVRMTILLDVRYSALRTTEVVHGGDSLIEILDNLNYKGSLPFLQPLSITFS